MKLYDFFTKITPKNNKKYIKVAILDKNNIKTITSLEKIVENLADLEYYNVESIDMETGYIYVTFDKEKYENDIQYFGRNIHE